MNGFGRAPPHNVFSSASASEDGFLPSRVLVLSAKQEDQNEFLHRDGFQTGSSPHNERILLRQAVKSDRTVLYGFHATDFSLTIDWKRSDQRSDPSIHQSSSVNVGR
jgi:hypothetical protein